VTTALEIVRPRTASELGDEVRAIDAPVRCCALPSCPRPAVDGSNLCSEHGGGAREPSSRARPMGDHEIASRISGAVATARYWASRYEGMAAVHAGTWVLGDLSARAERWRHIEHMAVVMLAVLAMAPRDVAVDTSDEVVYLRRLHADGPRLAASVGGFDAHEKRAREVADLIATALGGLRREVRALLGVVA